MDVLEEEEAKNISMEDCSELQNRAQYKLMDLALQGRLHLDSHGLGSGGRVWLHSMESRYCPGLVGSASPLADTGRYTTLVLKLSFYLPAMSPADQHFLMDVLNSRMFERSQVTEHRKV